MSELGRATVIAVVLIAGVGRCAFADQGHARRLLPKDGNTRLTYVAMGDSTVYGVGANVAERNYVSRLYERLRSVYPEARMVNLGVGGATGADVVNGQLGRAVALRPDLVTLSIGPNDITKGRTVAEYERDVETILQTRLGEHSRHRGRCRPLPLWGAPARSAAVLALPAP